MSKFLVLNNLDQLECYVAGSTGTIGLLLRRTLVRSVRYLAFGTLIANCHQQIHVQQRSLLNAEQQNRLFSSEAPPLCCRGGREVRPLARPTQNVPIPIERGRGVNWPEFFSM